MMILWFDRKLECMVLNTRLNNKLNKNLKYSGKNN